MVTLIEWVSYVVEEKIHDIEAICKYIRWD